MRLGGTGGLAHHRRRGVTDDGGEQVGVDPAGAEAGVPVGAGVEVVAAVVGVDEVEVLLFKGYDAEVFEDMREGLRGADVVMMLRLQKERMDGGFIPSEREYYHRYGLDAEKLSHAKPDAIVMHPGPINRGVEIDSDVADMLDRSIITRQVEMGVAVRMACLDVLTRRARGVPGWERPLGQGQWK